MKLTERKPSLPGWQEIPCHSLSEGLKKKHPELVGYSAWQHGATCVISSLWVDPTATPPVQEWCVSVSRYDGTGKNAKAPRPHDLRRALHAFGMSPDHRSGVSGQCVLFKQPVPG